MAIITKAKSQVAWVVNHKIKLISVDVINERYVSWRYNNQHYAACFADQQVIPYDFEGISTYFVFQTDPFVYDPETGSHISKKSREDVISRAINFFTKKPNLLHQQLNESERKEIQAKLDEITILTKDDIKELSPKKRAKYIKDLQRGDPKNYFRKIREVITRGDHGDYRVYNGVLGSILRDNAMAEFMLLVGMTFWHKFQFCIIGAGGMVILEYLVAMMFPEQFRMVFGM